MKILLTIITLLNVNYIIGCNCPAKPHLDIKDWNDTEVIFTGELTKIVKTATVKKLTFFVKKLHKGDLKNQKVNFIIPSKNHNQIFDYENEMFLGQQWILFAKTYDYNGVQKIKLKESSDQFCMRSRPLIKNDDDPYINFINKFNSTPNIENQTYYIDFKPIATGTIKNKLPEGNWKYYLSNNIENNYWEGFYKKGKQINTWVRKAINFKNEKVVIEKISYDKGVKKEHIKYNYINEIKVHIIYEKDKMYKFKYSNNQLILKMTYSVKTDSTSIEQYKNGNLSSLKTKKGRFF